MSGMKTQIIRHTCYNDCRGSGCPGHDMWMEYHGVSSTYVLYIDGEIMHVFDPATIKDFLLLLKVVQKEVKI